MTASVCRACGADWVPVGRGECIRCGSDATPTPVPSEVAETTAGEREGTCPSLCVERSHPGREHDETTDGCRCWELCAMGPTCPGANAGLERGCWRTAPTGPDAGEVEAVLYAHRALASSPSDTVCSCDRTWRKDADYRAHVAAHLAALLDRVRREEGERIAQAIDEEDGSFDVGEGYGGEYDKGVHQGLQDAARIARAASVGRGEGL